MTTQTRSLADEIIVALEKLADQNRSVNEKRYLKSPDDMRHIGVTVPRIRGVAKEFVRSNKDMSHDELVALVNELWSRNVHETRMAAIELLNAQKKLLSPLDAGLIEQLIDTSHTWAYVDNLAANTMGGLVARYPELNNVLDGWAVHENFWLRRAAVLALLLPLRKEDGGDFERFSRYAESMLNEKEFFIRKAIGWVLRETSKKRPGLVAEWLGPRAHLCSTLTVREATKYLPKVQSEKLIAAAKSGIPAA